MPQQLRADMTIEQRMIDPIAKAAKAAIAGSVTPFGAVFENRQRRFEQLNAARDQLGRKSGSASQLAPTLQLFSLRDTLRALLPLGITITCQACKTPGSFGPAKPWFRPPGFAHPWNVPAPSTPNEPNETAYATRAKLVMPSGSDTGEALNPRLRAFSARPHLLVSNSGPDSEGYDYCTRCGRIESVSAPLANLAELFSVEAMFQGIHGIILR